MFLGGNNSPLTSFALHGENPSHDSCQSLPISRVLQQLLLADLCDRVKLCLAVVVRRAPLGGDPATLLQSHQGSVNRALVQQDLIPAHLFNATRNAISM